MTTNTAVVSPRATTALPMGPSRTAIRIPGAATGGRLGAVEMHVDAGWVGPPAHVHQAASHFWYVLDGRVTLTVDGEVGVHERGACLWVPAGTTHAFSTVDGPACTLLQVDLDRPMDAYFAELHDTFEPGTPPDPAKVAEIMARHDTQAVLA